jgi:hypothetical protein
MKHNGTGFEDLHPTNAELVLALDCEIAEQQAEAVVEAIREHVAGCAMCRAQWDELQATSELMAEYHATFLQSQVPVHSEETDVFADPLGRGRAAERKPVESPALMRSWQKLMIAGVAAAAAILISVGMWFGIPSRSAPAVQQPPAQVATVVAPKEAGAIASAQAPRSRGRRDGARKQAATAITAIKKQTYFELPFSDASLPLDEATVVRVKLPAQSLRVAGVPVEEENANTMLLADLLLGMDGLPRGIRLVRNGSGMN